MKIHIGQAGDDREGIAVMVLSPMPDLAPSQANTLLSDLDQPTGYGSTFEGCELCRV